jgi:hypothetical protein
MDSKSLSKILLIPHLYYNHLQNTELIITPIDSCTINIYINGKLIYHKYQSMETLNIIHKLIKSKYVLLINEEIMDSIIIRQTEIIIEGAYSKQYIPILNM